MLVTISWLKLYMSLSDSLKILVTKSLYSLSFSQCRILMQHESYRMNHTRVPWNALESMWMSYLSCEGIWIILVMPQNRWLSSLSVPLSVPVLPVSMVNRGAVFLSRCSHRSEVLFFISTPLRPMNKPYFWRVDRIRPD